MRANQKKVSAFAVFNPFRKFGDKNDLIISARLLAIVAIYLALTGLARALGFAHQGVNILSRSYAPFLIECAAVLVVGLVLAWQIYLRQPLWAAIITAFWKIADIAFKSVGIAAGSRPLGLPFVVSSILLMWGVILATRANWKLYQLRRDLNVSS